MKDLLPHALGGGRPLYRYLALILALMWLVCYATGADLPADAQALVAKADKVVATIQAEAAFKVYKAQQAEIATLKRCQDAAMGKKDLDGATLIKAKIDDLQKQVDDYNAVLPGPDPIPPLVGSWDVLNPDGSTKCWLTITKEGKATETSSSAVGSLHDQNITWSNGTTWALEYTKGQWGFSYGGGTYTFQR